LLNRTQVVKVGGQLSSVSLVSSGVPQGSVLGLYFSFCLSMILLMNSVFSWLLNCLLMM